MNQFGFKPMEDFQEQKLLPDPFIKPDGSRITSPDEWPEQRKYLLEMLDYFLYGPMPPEPSQVKGTVLGSEKVYGGAAVADDVLLDCGEFKFKVRIQRPGKAGKFPAVCAYTLPPYVNQLPGEWETLCERDYILASVNVNDIAFDRAEGGGPIYDAYPGYEGKAIMAWTWGVMRVNDYLAGCDYVDAGKLMAAGCSRLGKQTLCTAIHDERIVLAGLFGSGCGGCGSFRILGTGKGPRQDSSVLETLGRMMYTFPHWFSENMLPFGMVQPPYTVKKEYRLPFDMHFARILLAPRCAICTNGLEDDWGNLYGDYGTWLAAQEVYEFLDADGNNAYFYRPGPHAYTREEWLAMLDFADLRFRGIEQPGLALLNKPIYDVDKSVYFNWRKPV